MSGPADMRQSYDVPGLTEAEAGPEPMPLFHRWFADAEAAGVKEPNAMTVATVDAAGLPDARVVLLKGFDGPTGALGPGFRFFTNYDSQKGRQLGDVPHAALVFYWDALDRQVRVRGSAHRLDAAESDAYFRSRPRGSRLGAWASPQSSVIPARSTLRAAYTAAEARHGEALQRPPTWGGYTVRADAIEFWQGQPGRLHDRLRYTRVEQGWRRERLAA